MRVRCPECRENFELSVNDHDEGDFVECPECSLNLIVEVREGKFKLVSEKEKFYEEDEFDQYYED